MHWGDTAKARTEHFGPLVLGIDPAASHAPHELFTDSDLFLERYANILLDAAQGKVGFVKFQSAYFEACGTAGVAMGLSFQQSPSSSMTRGQHS